MSLHASALVAANELRFAVHGTRGSYVKHGLDTQEDALKAGVQPRWPPAPGWGTDTGHSMLTSLQGDALATRAVPLLPGNYSAYYAGVRDAIISGAPNPVTPAQAITVMALIELGRDSAAQRRELPTPALASLTPG